MTVGKTAKISSPSMRRRKSALGEDDDLERETKALASFYPSPPPVDFVQSTMYGQYTKELGDYVKGTQQNIPAPVIHGSANEEFSKYGGKISSTLEVVWRHSFAKLSEDWVFLTLLGLVMAVLSFAMDYGIDFTNEGRIWLFKDMAFNQYLQYIAWVLLPVSLITFAAGFVHLVAPQSIGSGIPEMKTILRGVALKEFLTLRTLIAKVVGVTATLGSGLPLGKEGPFVHIASITATLLTKVITSFKGIYENESRNTEMLAAACAVGVASCFGAPIGGVLFSIEVTTVYFAVRNYWRGFFSAVCSATVFRLLAVWFNKAETVKAFFPTHFTMEYPFDPQELTVFALLGVVCGIIGAGYVWAHRQYVLFMRQSKRMNSFLQKNRFLYPSLITFLTLTITFPLGTGKYIAGELNVHDQLTGLFSNFTWTKTEFTIEEAEMMNHWRTENTNVFICLSAYIAYNFVFSIIASTIPIPSGSFIPVFKTGAAFGRIVGELMHLWFPYGVRHGKFITPIIPGGYAVVGAAAFAGAVTHSISVSVIAFEMTGQITHIVPVMIAVLISNAVAVLLQPSLYDSIILIKNLPYLPDLLPSISGIYSVYVEDFMVRDVKYIWYNMSYRDLKKVLRENKVLRVFPLVDKPDSMILLGSVPRIELIKLIDRQVGKERRMQVVAKWQKEAQERLDEVERRRRENKERRPSRFEVTPAPDTLQRKYSISSQSLSTNPIIKVQCSSSLKGHPKKSILKKTNSFTLHNLTPMMTPSATPYSTITGAESRIRLAFEAIFHKSATLRDANPEQQSLTDISDKDRCSSQIIQVSKKVQLPKERVIDMSPEEQSEWEQTEMDKILDFGSCHIDPAPFQLVERTSLLKVHSVFSLVGVNHAYVTAIGRLVGVVGLKELRKAIEDTNSGTKLGHHKTSGYRSAAMESLLSNRRMDDDYDV
ncbi:chloride channel protein 2 isoform X1 [Rhopalosiphum maidis]|uniref:chloride channel protein 2 isoform X1 n=2 Tax=Rhopalosiphum maidis TaxID=43146 RepID=UPI000EFFA30E|nr:chloride channel protein 2 isoform X1 [Rhopalosiphum maidis]XP_060849864.1 chloride channel protein 2 isoform X1 [Rhopalosiphum padi]